MVLGLELLLWLELEVVTTVESVPQCAHWETILFKRRSDGVLSDRFDNIEGRGRVVEVKAWCAIRVTSKSRNSYFQ